MFFHVEVFLSGGSEHEVSGNIGYAERDSGSNQNFGANYEVWQRKSGSAGQFLDSKGFGWLMEVDDDDEDMQEPLL